MQERSWKLFAIPLWELMYKSGPGGSPSCFCRRQVLTGLADYMYF